MRICVKLLKGKEHSFEVETDESVHSLKQKIAAKFDVSVSKQRLLFKGKALNDNQKVGFYSIVDGSKLVLSIPSLANETNSEEVLFFESIHSLLKNHFSGDEIPKIIRELKKDAKHVVEGLSLDDIERIANRRDNLT